MGYSATICAAAASRSDCVETDGMGGEKLAMMRLVMIWSLNGRWGVKIVP